jgi:hypothetical protein
MKTKTNRLVGEVLNTLFTELENIGVHGDHTLLLHHPDYQELIQEFVPMCYAFGLNPLGALRLRFPGFVFTYHLFQLDDSLEQLQGFNRPVALVQHGHVVKIELVKALKLDQPTKAGYIPYLVITKKQY